MKKNIAIQINNISKRYRIGYYHSKNQSLVTKIFSSLTSPIHNFKQLKKLTEFENEKNMDDVIYALKNVSFEVKAGEVYGIVGPNGAGKSTLLKILSKITNPSSGSININGKVASLLEVGTGFHPELTGRENIYLNGTILGMSKREVDERINQIISFSGIEKFIETPVKRFSTGMGLRLAFSIAAYLDPDILLIDEILAVGDAKFQEKCLGKMDEVSKSGRTILFVSHNMTAMRTLCTKGIYLSSGKILFDGDINECISKYLFDDSNIEIKDIENEYISIYEFSVDKINNKVEIMFDYSIKRRINNLCVGFTLYDANGNALINSFDQETYEMREHGRYKSKYSFDIRVLKPGRYSIRSMIMLLSEKWIEKGNICRILEVPLHSNSNNIMNISLLNQLGTWEIDK